MSHVDLKKWPCRHVEFKGQEHHQRASRADAREVRGKTCPCRATSIEETCTVW